ncbi:MAG: NPCBM/NEW2 domain-containing protein [Pirellulaceae bacterium]|nr:NPCBM/NEW2 domain-containing protein [Pirellulaceae bacterium]
MSVPPRARGARRLVLRLLACLVCLACWPLLGPASWAQEARGLVSLVVPVSGESFPARLRGLTAEQPPRVEWDVDGTVRSMSAGELFAWGRFEDRGAAPLVVLADGSLLAGEYQRLESNRLVWYSQLFGEFSVGLDQVRGLLLQPPTAPLERDRLLHRLRTAQRGSDRLLLDNGDELPGVLGPHPADVPRTDDDLDEAFWLTVAGREPAAIPRGRVTAVIFNPALLVPLRPVELAWEVGWSDGSLLQVAGVRAGDAVPDQAGGWFELLMPGGVRLASDVQTLRDDVTWLAPRGTRVRYLSDLESLGYKHIPFLGVSWDYAADRNVLGGRLRSGGQLWSKGLGMHSTSRLAFDLDGSAQQLRAWLALDDQAGRRGSVVFRVFAFRDDAWSAAYESPVIRGGDKPLPIAVDLTGARRLALIVEAADRGDELDHANWLGARLVSRTD